MSKMPTNPEITAYIRPAQKARKLQSLIERPTIALQNAITAAEALNDEEWFAQHQTERSLYVHHAKEILKCARTLVVTIGYHLQALEEETGRKI